MSLLTNFLGSFLNDWWNSIRIFFHEMDTVVKSLIITGLVAVALLGLIRFIKPMYSVDKNKLKIMPLIIFIVFMGLACLVIFI
jgi:hypothetical protein